MDQTMKAPVVAILGYHKVGEPESGWPTWFWVSERQFVQQLEIIRQSNWHPIDLSTFLFGLQEPTALPARAILLTFDDAHRSVKTLALPWLRRFGYPAVLFVPTDFVGREDTFDAKEPLERLCDWDDLCELEGAGVSIQSHTATHRPFSTLDAASREAEIMRSRDALEVRLEKRIETLAFPYGDDGGDAAMTSALLERAGYRGGFLYGGGPVTLPTNPYRLSRVPVGPTTNLAKVLR